MDQVCPVKFLEPIRSWLESLIFIGEFFLNMILNETVRIGMVNRTKNTRPSKCTPRTPTKLHT